MSELTHYGVLGMHWGVRRTPAQLGNTTSKKKKRSGADDDDGSNQNGHAGRGNVTASKKKGVKTLTDDELRAKINRLELEKKYTNLMKETNPPKSTAGREFVKKVLKNSGENIATQATTYGLGKAVNAMFRNIAGEDIVNPKKGQKDKK